MFCTIFYMFRVNIFLIIRRSKLRQYTILTSWWWTRCLLETCRGLYNTHYKIKIVCIKLVSTKIILSCTVIKTWNSPLSVSSFFYNIQTFFGLPTFKIMDAVTVFTKSSTDPFQQPSVSDPHFKSCYSYNLLSIYYYIKYIMTSKWPCTFQHSE